MKKWRLHLLTVLFVALAIFDTVLAWGGDNFALVVLCGLAVFTSILMGVYGKMVREILDGWRESTTMWGHSQAWGQQHSAILKDALNDLAEYDAEATAIHSGRAMHANTKYLETLKEEETNVGNSS